MCPETFLFSQFKAMQCFPGDLSLFRYHTSTSECSAERRIREGVFSTDLMWRGCTLVQAVQLRSARASKPASALSTLKTLHYSRSCTARSETLSGPRKPSKCPSVGVNGRHLARGSCVRQAVAVITNVAVRVIDQSEALLPFDQQPGLTATPRYSLCKAARFY